MVLDLGTDMDMDTLIMDIVILIMDMVILIMVGITLTTAGEDIILITDTDIAILSTGTDTTTIIIPIIQDEEALHTLMKLTTTIDILKTLLRQEMQVTLITEETPLIPIIAQLETTLPL